VRTKNPEDLAREAAKHYWWHSIDLGQGVVTQGEKSLEICAAEARAHFDRVDLTGRSVIDVGAWNGFFSFEAKRRGAKRVLATDHYTWTHNHFRGREAFEFARNSLHADVEMLECDLDGLTLERVGKFDVVLFLGVFYHLYDPIEGLQVASRLTNELLIIETALDLQSVNRPAMAFYPGSELNDDPTSWWAPNPMCMVALLQGLGFAHIDATVHPTLSRGRGIFHAWRSTKGRLRDPAPENLLSIGPSQASDMNVASLSRHERLRLGWRLIRRAFRG
jgi:tRNA (mo5U34)-methyltransferase